MNKVNNKEEFPERDEKILKLVRIITRGSAPVLLLLMIAVAIGQGGMDRLIHLSFEEGLILGGILCMFFGMVWAYQNEIAGGIIIVLVYIIVAITYGKLFPNAYLPIFLIIGILNIYLGIMENLLRRKRRM